MPSKSTLAPMIQMPGCPTLSFPQTPPKCPLQSGGQAWMVASLLSFVRYIPPTAEFRYSRQDRAANLLSEESFALGIGSGCALDGARFFDETRVQFGRDSRDDSMVIAGELGCRDRYRRRPPDMVGSVPQKAAHFGLPAWPVKASGCTMTSPNRRKARKSRRQSWAATGLLRNENFIK